MNKDTNQPVAEDGLIDKVLTAIFYPIIQILDPPIHNWTQHTKLIGCGLLRCSRCNQYSLYGDTTLVSPISLETHGISRTVLQNSKCIPN